MVLLLLFQTRSILYHFLENVQYLNQLADNQKNKGTLLFQTLKVGEEKVLSEFRCVACWPRIGRLKIFAIQNQKPVLATIVVGIF